MADASAFRTHPGGGRARVRRRHHPRALRRAAGQGRGGGHAARAGHGAAVGGCGAAGCAHQFFAAQGPRHRVHRPGRRAHAPARLAQRAERCAVEGKPGGRGADPWRLAQGVSRRRRAAGPDVRQRHAADRRRADGGRCGARAAASRPQPAEPLAGFRCRKLERIGRRRQAARGSRARAPEGSDVRQRHRPARSARRARERRGRGRGRPDRFQRMRCRRTQVAAVRTRQRGLQSAVRRAPGGRQCAVPQAGRRAEAQRAAVARRPAVRQRRTRLRHRPARRQEVPDVQRRHRVRTDRVRSGGSAEAGNQRGARAIRRRTDGRQPLAQEPAQAEGMDRARGRDLLPCVRRRPARVRGGHRRLQGRIRRHAYVPACAGVRRAGRDTGSRRAPPPQRVAGRGARSVRCAGPNRWR